MLISSKTLLWHGTVKTIQTIFTFTVRIFLEKEQNNEGS